MYRVDEETGEIFLSRGDTMSFTLKFTGYTLTSSDRVMVTIKDRKGMLVKEYVETPVDNMVVIQIRNPDTDYLNPAFYQWDARVIIDPVYDDQQNIIDGGSVSTPKLPMNFEIAPTVGQI